jgi:hypothetical protein
VAVSFHLIPLELGAEEELLDQAVDALEEVEPGETAFLPELVAWTSRGAGRAFARLVALAQARNINVVTTLNLGGELIHDLPGHDPLLRYNALTIFTRHGAAHVPQAKITPQSFETTSALGGPGIEVSPYLRLNRVRVDVDDELLDFRFVIGSDLAVMTRLTPAELECDVLVVLANFAFGAERAAARLLGQALDAGAARTAIHVNAFVSAAGRKRALARKVEEVLDATKRIKPRARWPKPRSLRSAFFIYEDRRVRDFASMAELPDRRSRIALPASRWPVELQLGEYPVTVVL